MKKKKNFAVKLTAGLALAAILISVIGTGILFVYEAYFNSPAQVQDLTQEELEALIEQLQLEVEEPGDGDIEGLIEVSEFEGDNESSENTSDEEELNEITDE